MEIIQEDVENLQIVTAPDKRLNRRAPLLDTKTIQIVPTILVIKMMDLMKEKGGVGLAAPQVGINARFFVTEAGAVINPRIISTSRENAVFDEGCLSIPGVHLSVPRPAKIRVTYVTLDHRIVSQTLFGLDAVIFQHELDHLNGVLFTQRFAEQYDAN